MKKVFFCLSVLSVFAGHAAAEKQTANEEVSTSDSQSNGSLRRFEKWVKSFWHSEESSKNESEKRVEVPLSKPGKQSEEEISGKKDEFSISIDDAGPVTSQEDIDFINEQSELARNERKSKKKSFIAERLKLAENEKNDSEQKKSELAAVENVENASAEQRENFVIADDERSEPQVQQVAVKNENDKRIENVYDDVAKKIAGLGEKISSEYSTYCDEISKSWNELGDASLMKVRAWAEKNLDEHTKSIRRVFYAFGGPDIAYPCQFFPHADEYILIGLEPLGNFQEIKQLADAGNFNVFRSAISSYLKKGYFITSEMGAQLSRRFGGSRGGLGMIMLQLARMNYEVVSIEPCGINSDGEIVNSGADVLPIVKIIFKKNAADESLSAIYYVRMDLSNRNAGCLKKVCNFTKQREFISFIKSASYILQDRNFSILRNFILCNTEAILQDDTGIAFNMLSRWNKHIFGTYSGATLRIFKNYIQYDMVEYFKNHPTKEIDFQIGYGFDQKRPSLVLALRGGLPKDSSCLQKDIGNFQTQPVSVIIRRGVSPENFENNQENKKRVKDILINNFKM